MTQIVYRCSMAKIIYVYNGPGVSEVAFKHLYKALRSYTSCSVFPVTPDEIISSTKLDSAALIAFGGGFTTGFAKALGEEGIQRLKSFVHNGGSYLGFGAGGYFGCDYVWFDKGGPLEKFAERDLRFFPGTGEGPAYPGFEYGTNKGVHAAPIHFQSKRFDMEFNAYIDGGGSFIQSELIKPGSNVTEVNVIASFLDLPKKPAAIVQTRVGNGGRAILSGVHLEYDTLSMIDSDGSLSVMRDQFERSVVSQKTAFLVLLDLLGIGSSSSADNDE